MEKIPYRNEPAGLRLDSIYNATRDLFFSKNVSAIIVGSRTKLEKLVGIGLIRAEKSTSHQHGKWMCNASDVLRYAISIMETNRKK